MLAEALCLDVPCVVNRRILGGWKYVNSFTGELFDDVGDVADGVRRCLAQARSPRSWFRTNYGPYHAGRRLGALLRQVDPSLAVAEDAPLRLSRRLEPARTR